MSIKNLSSHKADSHEADSEVEDVENSRLPDTFQRPAFKDP